MDLTLKFEKENGIIISRPRAPINKENVWQTLAKTVEYSKSHNCYLLLFDIRQCSVDRPLMEGFFDMQNLLQIKGVSIKHKMAILYDPSLYPEERARFIENVVVNRPNPTYRMFDDKKEAIRWLLEFK